MRGLMVDGPNRGTVVNIPDHRGTVYKIVDPKERPARYRVDLPNMDEPIKVNTYYLCATNPFAQAYGFDVLLRWSH